MLGPVIKTATTGRGIDFAMIGRKPPTTSSPLPATGLNGSLVRLVLALGAYEAAAKGLQNDYQKMQAQLKTVRSEAATRFELIRMMRFERFSSGFAQLVEELWLHSNRIAADFGSDLISPADFVPLLTGLGRLQQDVLRILPAWKAIGFQKDQHTEHYRSYSWLGFVEFGDSLERVNQAIALVLTIWYNEIFTSFEVEDSSSTMSDDFNRPRRPVPEKSDPLLMEAAQERAEAEIDYAEGVWNDPLQRSLFYDAMATLLAARAGEEVLIAREDGRLWAEIGAAYGVAGQSAYRRFDPDGRRKQRESRQK